MRCVSCGRSLRRRWWQRWVLTPVALCRWDGPDARACAERAARR